MVPLVILVIFDVMRVRSVFLVNVVSAASLALATSAALAQQAPYDYFAPRTAEAQQRLSSNEAHHLYKGINHLRSGDPNSLFYAKGEFDFILGYWPNHPRVLTLQAETLIRQGRPDLIDPYFDRAFEMSPNEAMLYVAYGVVLLKQNRVDDAIKNLRRGVELNENSVNGQYNLGLALVKAKRYEEANRHAQLAYALGHPLPGLREQLRRAGAWKPDKPETAKREASKEKSPG